MLYLAYDGSLNGDWVSRYAIRFAAQTAERTLALVHVLDGSLSAAELERKLDHIEQECRVLQVEFLPRLLPLQKSVRHTLMADLPPGPQSLVVCGTRVRSRQRAYLAGTVTERLLAGRRFNLLAVRVVQPGLLGAPRDLLLPLAGHPRRFGAAWPFFRLFLPELESVHLLRGIVVGPWRLRRLTVAQTQALREEGVRYLAAVDDEIRAGRGAADFHLDSRIVVCDDWVREILVHASKLKAQMILLGATERSRLHRAVRGDALERVLRGAPCDVGIYRGV